MKRVIDVSTAKLDGTKSLQECLKECMYTSTEFIARKLPPRYVSKKVHFNKRNLTIDIDNGTYTYEVDLEQCCSPTKLVDWIYQIFNKTWMTPQLIYEFLWEFERAFGITFGKNNPQGNLDKKWDWKHKRLISKE
jgi:hypothetical protein